MAKGALAGKTVIIAGASSGLGRAAALEFAREGASLGLIARSRDGLVSLRQEILSLQDFSDRCRTYEVDVTDATGMREAAKEAARAFGGIDVWVNNAAVSIYGELDKVPIEDFRRQMDVNFFGQLIGVRSALPFLEHSRGPATIVGVLSVLSEAAVPLQPVYVASKHALLGMYKSFAEELMHRGSRVRLATVLAPSMDTPFFDHARTYMGYHPKPIPPVYAPERIAKVIVRQALHPRFRVAPTLFGKFAVAMFRGFPGLAMGFESRTAYRAQRSREPKGIADGDNLYRSMPESSAIHGSTKLTRGATFYEALAAGAALALAFGALRGVRSRIAEPSEASEPSKTRRAA